MLSWLRHELHEVPASNLLRAAAYYHVKFEYIHPFADGNGRTGRLTMNYFLVLNGHPPITIHQEDRKEYYAVLEAWDERQELTPMEDFLRAQTGKTWEKQIERSKAFRAKLIAEMEADDLKPNPC